MSCDKTNLASHVSLPPIRSVYLGSPTIKSQNHLAKGESSQGSIVHRNHTDDRLVHFGCNPMRTHGIMVKTFFVASCPVQGVATLRGACAMNDPRQHVNEEPRNDLIDVGLGFLGMFGLLFVIATVATIIQITSK